MRGSGPAGRSSSCAARPPRRSSCPIACRGASTPPAAPADCRAARSASAEPPLSAEPTLQAPAAGEKGPAARRRPQTGREAYFLYVERPGQGGNEADGPFSPAASAAGEGAVEGLGEVGDEVVGVFDSDRVANEVVLDPDLEPLLGGQLVEAHDGGLLDEALDAPQGDGEVRDGAGVDHAGGGVDVAADLERD